MVYISNYKIMIRISKIPVKLHLIALYCILFGLPSIVIAQEEKVAEIGKKQEAVIIEEGEPAPFSGYLITDKQLTKCLQDGIDIKDLKILTGKQKDLIVTYEKKDVSVKQLIENVDHLTKILDYYKTLTDGLIDTQKPKSKLPRFGVYGGINSMTLDGKVGGGYNVGFFVGF